MIYVYMPESAKGTCSLKKKKKKNLSFKDRDAGKGVFRKKLGLEERTAKIFVL